MPRRARLAAIAVFGLIGFGSAMAISAGANDVRACISERSGNAAAPGRHGMQRSGDPAKISADLFKSAKNGVLFHGVAFKRGRNRGITINGNSFRNGTLPNTLTINGNSFRSRHAAQLADDQRQLVPHGDAAEFADDQRQLVPHGDAAVFADLSTGRASGALATR